MSNHHLLSWQKIMTEAMLRSGPKVQMALRLTSHLIFEVHISEREKERDRERERYAVVA